MEKQAGGASWWVGLAVILLLSGCTQSRQEESGYPMIGGPAALLTEDLRIDGHEEELVPIWSIAVSRDGTIAVLQEQEKLVRLFSATGESLGTFGSRGEGPGEFLLPHRLGWHRDTLWVVDRSFRRATFISPSLELVRTESYVAQSARLDGSDGTHRNVTFRMSPRTPGLRGGVYAVLNPPRGQSPPQPFTEYGTLGYVDSQGVVQNVILPLHRDGASGPPFYTFPRSSIAVDVGRAAVAMAPSTGQDAGTLSLVAVDLEGDTMFNRRYSFQGEAIPETVMDSVSAVYATNSAASRGDVTTRGGEAPSIYPPLLGFRIGDDASFWVRLRARDGQRPYYVLGPDGEPFGRVSLPDENWIAAATLDRIWVIEADHLGVESVVRYGVEWKGSATHGPGGERR